MPAAERVVLKDAPGAIVPEFHAPPFAVEVWAMESLLTQVSVLPTATVIGLGA